MEPAHLARAAALTIRGKRLRPDVAWFLFRREGVLADIESALRRGDYEPEGFDLLFIHDPKPRAIARASIADRVVHTALVSLMEPALTRSITDDDFACRPGYGTHRARLRLLEFVRRHRFALHLDVRSYFPSIDLGVLRALLRPRIQDGRFLAVVDRVLDAGAGLYDSARARRHARLDPDWPPPGRGGLPIGALTSQLFAAHVYLHAFDHFVKRDLHVPGYLRYVDDLFLFGDSRAALRGWRSAAARYLGDERRLRLKRPDAPVLSCAGHLDALGVRIRRTGIEPRPRALSRLRAAVARVASGEDLDERIREAMASRVGGILFA